MVDLFPTGSTYLDEHNETTLALLHWKEAQEIRSKNNEYIGKLKFIFSIVSQNTTYLFNSLLFSLLI